MRTKEKKSKNFTPTPISSNNFINAKDNDDANIARDQRKASRRIGVSLRSKRGFASVSSNDGFTLIELMVAVSIFTIVMTIAMGSIISVFDANRKSRSLTTVLNNLNLAVESMSKEMTFGKNYHCGSGTVTVPQNCPNGDNLMSFLSSDGLQITYRFNNQSIEKRIDGGDFIAVTAPEIVIDDLVFYTLGAGTSDTLQPKVIIKIQSYAGTGKGRTDFTLQTLVSQRPLDI